MVLVAWLVAGAAAWAALAAVVGVVVGRVIAARDRAPAPPGQLADLGPKDAA